MRPSNNASAIGFDLPRMTDASRTGIVPDSGFFFGSFAHVSADWVAGDLVLVGGTGGLLQYVVVV